MPRPPVRDVNWLLEGGAKPGARPPAVLRVNNIYGILRAVRAGSASPRCRISWRRALTIWCACCRRLRAADRRLLRLSRGTAFLEAHRVFRDFLLRKVAEGRLG